MKTKQLILSGTVVVMSVALSFTGCRKDRNNQDTDTSGAEDNALADKSFEDVGQISNEAANSTNGKLGSFRIGAGNDGLLSTCATLTHDTARKTIVVDFGTANCLCNDGRYRRGKIFISYTTGFRHLGYWDSLANITITTSPADDYFVGAEESNMHQVIGTKSITNNGHNANHHMNWSVVVGGKIIKANNQGTVTWKSDRRLEWLAGESTPFIWGDDEYGVTGSASVTSAKGIEFNVNITSQIVRKISCPKHFVSGTFDFTPGTKPVRHVDFSPPNNGACDDIATVTINGSTYTVHMK